MQIGWRGAGCQLPAPLGCSCAKLTAGRRRPAACTPQGLFHPARKVREVYWRLYNSTYIGAQVQCWLASSMHAGRVCAASLPLPPGAGAAWVACQPAPALCGCPRAQHADRLRCPRPPLHSALASCLCRTPWWPVTRAWTTTASIPSAATSWTSSSNERPPASERAPLAGGPVGRLPQPGSGCAASRACPCFHPYTSCLLWTLCANQSTGGQQHWLVGGLVAAAAGRRSRGGADQAAGGKAPQAHVGGLAAPVSAAAGLGWAETAGNRSDGMGEGPPGAFMQPACSASSATVHCPS